MSRKMLRTIATSLVLCCFFAVIPVVSFAQCDSGDCGDVFGQSPEFDYSYDYDVESEQTTGSSGCADGRCPQSCCPAVKCGPYISVFGGWSTVDNFSGLGSINQSTQALPNPNPPPASIFVATATQLEQSFQTGDGPAWGFAIGRQVHAQARMELEGAYREYDFDSLRIQEFSDTFTTLDPNEDPVFNLIPTNFVTDAAVGNLQSYSIMGNFLYDFSPRCLRKYNLYGGGGIGAITVSGTATTATNVYDFNDSTFAYQIILGVNRSVTRRLDVFMDYQYLSAASITVDDVTAGNSLGAFDFDSNNLFFGMRLRK